jgi:hypothetical protein
VREPLRGAGSIHFHDWLRVPCSGASLRAARKLAACHCPKNDTLKRGKLHLVLAVAETKPSPGVIPDGAFGMEFAMRPAPSRHNRLLLLLGSGVAEAADTAQLAETAGFLLGNAHRCGAPTTASSKPAK